MKFLCFVLFCVVGTMLNRFFIVNNYNSYLIYLFGFLVGSLGQAILSTEK